MAKAPAIRPAGWAWSDVEVEVEVEGRREGAAAVWELGGGGVRGAEVEVAEEK